MDYTEEISAIRGEWSRQNPDGAMPVVEVGSWIISVRSDEVIVEAADKLYEVAYTKDDDGVVTFAPREDWQEVERAYVPAKGNALKTLSRTPAEIRVGNYIVLFGGRDLEGLSPGKTDIVWTNPNGTRGEYFTADTAFESGYTKSGRLYVDWEHGRDDNKGAPGRDDVLGYVDWSTAKADERGVWVERALDRHNEYMRWLEQLIDAGIVGTSSAAIPDKIQKSADGAITSWPLERDTLTVMPMEWRNKTENVVLALKALGLNINEPEAEPEDGTPSASVMDSVEQTAAEVAKVAADVELFFINTLQED